MQLSETASRAIRECSEIINQISTGELRGDGEISNRIWRLYRDIESNRREPEPSGDRSSIAELIVEISDVVFIS